MFVKNYSIPSWPLSWGTKLAGMGKSQIPAITQIRTNSTFVDFVVIVELSFFSFCLKLFAGVVPVIFLTAVKLAVRYSTSKLFGG